MNRREFIGGVVATLAAVCASVAVGAVRYENPVIAEDWPDPTVWDGEDGWHYSVATQLRTVRRSRGLFCWEDTGRDPLTPAARSELTRLTGNLWAPSVVRIGKKWMLYISLFINREDNRIQVLSSDSPYGPFEFRGNVIDSRRERILNTIDPYVLGADGKVWMFFGSCQDGVHCVELTDDGLSIKPGATPRHVAGLRNPGGFERAVDIWGRKGTWEGSYVLRRHGWWFLFVSGGIYSNHTYYLTVGRSRSIDGEYLDREGRPMTRGLAEPILRSDKEDRFFGPGHNGDVFTTPDGRDWMFFHAHDATRAKAGDRPTLIQELKWTDDAWPCFEGGKPQDGCCLHQSNSKTNEQAQAGRQGQLSHDCGGAISDCVDPMIGTVGTGHAFPGPCRPFGMVQPSPDTGNGSWKYCSGYSGEDLVIRRFSQTHLNGTGQAGLGDIGLLPFVGETRPDVSRLCAHFKKENERAVFFERRSWKSELK